jgi:hypothetical protein
MARISPVGNIGRSKSSRQISAADIVLVQKRGAAVLTYYQHIGLGEVRSRATDLVLSGLICLGGITFFDWTALTMLAFMVVDALITVLSDVIKYGLAWRWVAQSHRIDHEAGTVLLIADGLEDGSGTYPERGTAPAPGTILFFGVAASIFLLPLVGAALSGTGIEPIKALLEEETFRWIVLADLVLRFIAAALRVIRARTDVPGKHMIFMESGGVAVLYAGLLILIWLPIEFGEPGLYVLSIILYGFRIGFGIFALYWTPRSVRNLQRRVLEGDMTLRLEPGAGLD